MRRVTASLIAAIGLCTGATPASAFTIWAGGDFDRVPGDWVVGEKVTVVLYLEADQPGIQLLSVGVLFDDSTLQYNPKPNSSVGVASYILYGMPGMMSPVSLVAARSTWTLWPGSTPPGKKQVNVDWATFSYSGTYATGVAKIAELEFEVFSLAGVPDIEVTLSGAGNIFQVNFNPSAPLQLRFIPEPTTILLLGLGMAGLAVARSRRASP